MAEKFNPLSSKEVKGFISTWITGLNPDAAPSRSFYEAFHNALEEKMTQSKISPYVSLLNAFIGAASLGTGVVQALVEISKEMDLDMEIDTDGIDEISSVLERMAILGMKFGMMTKSVNENVAVDMQTDNFNESGVYMNRTQLVVPGKFNGSEGYFGLEFHAYTCPDCEDTHSKVFIENLEGLSQEEVATNFGHSPVVGAYGVVNTDRILPLAETVAPILRARWLNNQFKTDEEARTNST